MKKTAALLFALLILFAATAVPRANAESFLSGLFRDLFSGSSDPGPLSQDSLWGHRVQPEFVSIEADCLTEDDRLLGISRDGRRALIEAADGSCFLLDLSGGQQISLTLAQATVSDVEDAILRYAEDADVSETTLEAYFTAINASNGVTRWFRPNNIQQGDGNTLYAYDALTGCWTIDCDTGTAYGPLVGPLSICGGQGVYLNKARGAVLMDLKTGAEQYLALPDTPNFPNGVKATAVRFLEDGSIAAVVRDSKLDRVSMANALALFRNGSVRYYLLAKQRFGTEPDSILPLGSRYALLYSRPYCQATMPIVLDLETGQATVLYSKPSLSEDMLGSMPLEESLNEAGIPTLPEGCRGMVSLAAMADEETFLVQLLTDGVMALYRPATGESQALYATDGTIMSMPVFMGFSTNGYNCFVSCFSGNLLNRENDLQYLRFTVR